MAAHINILSDGFATKYGVILGTGAEAESASATTTVEINELIDSATASVIDAAPIHHAEKVTQVDGEGPISLALTPGVVASPETLTVLDVSLTETPNARVQFSVRAQGDLSFTDSAGEPGEVGAEPTISDLEIVSVTYSFAESVRRQTTLENKVLIAADGTPGARATCTMRKPFSISGRGDLPAGVALGTGNVEFIGADTGLTLASSLTEGERRADWNHWSLEGTNYPAAS